MKKAHELHELHEKKQKNLCNLCNLWFPFFHCLRVRTGYHDELLFNLPGSLEHDIVDAGNDALNIIQYPFTNDHVVQ
jgi:hypothetical protein